MIALALFAVGLVAVVLLCLGVWRLVFPPRRPTVVIERLDPKGGRLR